MRKALCKRMRSGARWHFSTTERVFFLFLLGTNLREITRQDLGRKGKKAKVSLGDGTAASQDLKSAIFFLLFFMDDGEVTVFQLMVLLHCCFLTYF